MARLGVRLEPVGDTADKLRVSGLFRRKLLESMKGDGGNRREGLLIRAYFRAWDALGQQTGMTSDNGPETTALPNEHSDSTGPTDRPENSAGPDSAHRTATGSPAHEQASMWGTLCTNDTRQLMARQGIGQLLRPWGIFYTHVAQPRTPHSIGRQLSRARRTVQPIAAKATRKMKDGAVSVGTSALSALPEERQKQLVAAYKATARSLTKKAMDDGDEDALTVCGLMQGFFSAAAIEGGVRVAAGSGTSAAGARAIWKQVPQETVRLTYLDAAL